MAPGEVSGLKNGESVMAGVLEGDYKDKMVATGIFMTERTGVKNGCWVFQPCIHVI